MSRLLPDEGPATLAAVKASHLEIDPEDTEDDVFIASVVAAVNNLVRPLPVAQVARGALEWTEADHGNVLLGANMLAARLVRRRNSPQGVAAFGDQGPIYVQRNDPDIALLLKLGAHARPQAR